MKQSFSSAGIILLYYYLGDKLRAHYDNKLVLQQPRGERGDCRSEFVIFLPIDPKITKIEHLKVKLVILRLRRNKFIFQNQKLSVFNLQSHRECDIQLDDTGSIRKSVCWIFKRKVKKSFILPSHLSTPNYHL